MQMSTYTYNVQPSRQPYILIVLGEDGRKRRGKGTGRRRMWEGLWEKRSGEGLSWRLVGH